MSRIVVIGGHGKIALQLAPLLVEAGHEVTSVIRSLEQVADVEATGARAEVLDVEHADVPGLVEVIEGADAVVWSAGAGGGDASRTYAVDRDAAIRSMQATMHAGVRRYVMVSYLGAGPDHGIDPDDGFYAYAQAKAAADEHLRGTDLDWTILGPTTLSDEPGTGGIEVARHPAARQVARATVAQVVAAALAQPATIHRTVDFADGQTPVEEALAAL